MAKVILYSIIFTLVVVPFLLSPYKSGAMFAVTLIGCWSAAAWLTYRVHLGKKRIRELADANEAVAMAQSLPLSAIAPTRALLQSGERAYATASANLLETKVTGFSAGSTGVSIRVAKGISVRTGGSRGRAIRESIRTSSGELVVTDRRIIFAGDNKSFVIRLPSLVNVENYSDGFGFSNGKTTYTVLVDSIRERILFRSTLNRVLQGEPEETATT